MKLPGTDAELADELGRLIAKEVWTCSELERFEKLTELACGRLRQLEWRPFAKAPKDGTWIEAVGGLETAVPLHVKWAPALDAWITQGCGVRKSSSLTHFREIGPLPKGEA